MSRPPLTPLTNAERYMLRTVIDEAIDSVRRSVPDADDRLAAFFGCMLGRAGFDPRINKLGELWAESSAHTTPLEK